MRKPIGENTIAENNSVTSTTRTGLHKICRGARGGACSLAQSSMAPPLSLILAPPSLPSSARAAEVNRRLHGLSASSLRPRDTLPSSLFELTCSMCPKFARASLCVSHAQIMRRYGHRSCRGQRPCCTHSRGPTRPPPHLLRTQLHRPGTWSYSWSGVLGSETVGPHEELRARAIYARNNATDQTYLQSIVLDCKCAPAKICMHRSNALSRLSPCVAIARLSQRLSERHTHACCAHALAGCPRSPALKS